MQLQTKRMLLFDLVCIMLFKPFILKHNPNQAKQLKVSTSTSLGFEASRSSGKSLHCQRCKMSDVGVFLVKMTRRVVFFFSSSAYFRDMKRGV